jgi:hypothetical protein
MRAANLQPRIHASYAATHPPQRALAWQIWLIIALNFANYMFL